MAGRNVCSCCSCCLRVTAQSELQEPVELTGQGKTALEFQLDADLLANLLAPVLQAVETVSGDGFLVEYLFDIAGQVGQRCGVAADGLLDGREFDVDRLQLSIQKLFDGLHGNLRHIGLKLRMVKAV